MPFNIPQVTKISIDPWHHPHFGNKGITVDVLRLDKMHPEISGNKWFKLKYYLEHAQKTEKSTLVSFGGAYSNHLLALASAAALFGFSSQALIRGEEPAHLSPILLKVKEFGMELRFLSREEFNLKKNTALVNDEVEFGKDSLLIPEGGSGREGIRGAEEILSGINASVYTHICCAVGTGTTLAGIINSSGRHQKKIGVSVLKGTAEYRPLIPEWIENAAGFHNVQINHEDHFGGYAKYTHNLIDFMNKTYALSGIPTDFVYTGKLFFSIARMAENNEFPTGSRILILHSGGLAGNQSLAPGLLQF